MREEQIRRVWEGLLTSEILSNYFAELSHAYHRKQRVTTWLTLFVSSGTVVSLLLALPGTLAWIRVGLAIFTAAMSAYTVVAQNQKCALDSAELFAKWDRLASQYRALWEDVYAKDAEARLEQYDDIARELSRAGTSFPNIERKMLKWQTYVEERHRVPAAA